MPSPLYCIERGHRVAIELLDPSSCMRQEPHPPTGGVTARFVVHACMLFSRTIIVFSTMTSVLAHEQVGRQSC